MLPGRKRETGSPIMLDLINAVAQISLVVSNIICTCFLVTPKSNLGRRHWRRCSVGATHFSRDHFSSTDFVVCMRFFLVMMKWAISRRLLNAKILTIFNVLFLIQYLENRLGVAIEFLGVSDARNTAK